MVRESLLRRLLKEIEIPSQQELPYKMHPTNGLMTELKSEPPPPRLPSALFIWGPSSSGKKYILNKALKKSRIKHIIRVCGSEITYGREAFLESIIVQMRRGAQQKQRREVCDNNLTWFHQELKLLCREVSGASGGTPNERIVLVIDKAHLLAPNHSELLGFFQSCQDYTNHNLGVIFCSVTHPTLLFDSRYNSTTGMSTIHCPRYTNEEIIQIIAKKHSAGIGKKYEFYLLFVTNIVTMLQHTCTDLLRLWRFINFHHAEFEERRLNESDLGALCKKLVAKFKTDSLLLDKYVIGGTPSICAKRKIVEDISPKFLEMPIAAKKLIIAAFLASKNPVPVKILSFQEIKTAKERRSAAQEVDQPPPVAKGPVIFTEERLLSIYSKISGEPCVKKSAYLSGISELCSNGLLVRSDDNPDACKYRCLAHGSLIKQICSTINFPLGHYLRLPIPSILFDKEEFNGVDE